jgi:hypothetical protein
MATLGRRNISQVFLVAAGSPLVVGSGDDAIPIPFPAVVEARPGSGGTLLVETRVTADGSWSPWDGGAVSAVMAYALNAPVNALRFTAAVANGSVGVSQ